MSQSYSHNDFSGNNYNNSVQGGYTQTPSKQPQFQNTREQCLLPLMISQILEAPIPEQDEPFRIDGVETTNVSVVATITKKEVGSVNTTITLKDSTGEVDAKIWEASKDKQNVVTNDDLLKEGTTIRAIGRIKVFNRVPGFSVYGVLPIEDKDEVELHGLEAKYAHLMNTRNIRETPFWEENESKQNGMSSRRRTNNENRDTSNNNNNTSMFDSRQSIGGISSNLNGMDLDANDVELDNLTQLQKALYVEIRKHSASHTGCALTTIIKAFPNEDVNNIKDGLEHLSNEGMTYTTVDEEHFRIMD